MLTLRERIGPQARLHVPGDGEHLKWRIRVPGMSGTLPLSTYKLREEKGAGRPFLPETSNPQAPGDQENNKHVPRDGNLPRPWPEAGTIERTRAISAIMAKPRPKHLVVVHVRTGGRSVQSRLPWKWSAYAGSWQGLSHRYAPLVPRCGSGV